MMRAFALPLFCGIMLLASLPQSAHAACGQNAAQYGKPGCPYPSFGTYTPAPAPSCHWVRRGWRRVRVCAPYPVVR